MKDFMEAPLERKEQAAPKAAEPTDVKGAIKTVMTSFEEFKSANDERLKELEAKGASDPLLDEKLDKINAELDKFEGFSAKLEKQEKTAQALEELKAQFDRMETAIGRTGAGEAKSDPQRVENWARAVFSAFTNPANVSADQRKSIDEVRDEYKALSLGTDTAGGYLAPVEMVREILKDVTETSPVRTLARVRNTSFKAISQPKRTGIPQGGWGTEGSSSTDGVGSTYGLIEIPTHVLRAYIDISNEMIEDSAYSMEEQIMEDGAEAFAYYEGLAFVNGDGVAQPEGFMQASGVGTTNSGAATAVTADGLLSLKHAIKTAYTASANFVMNRTTLGSVRKLKDGSGQYLWIPGIAAGKPNTIDGDPYVELPDMPNEGAGLKPVAYGDFRKAYTWVDRIAMDMLRDPFTQAVTDQTRFHLRRRAGGQVVLAEAIRTLTCAA